MVENPTPSAASPGPEEILDLVRDHEGYVRSLARALLHDEHAVDDVVQQAWLRALKSPPRETGVGQVRSWFRTVVQNLVSSDAQSTSARRRREQVAFEVAGSETSVPSVAEISDRECARRDVVESVLALPAKYRDVLVLRYLEGMTPRAIAKRLSLPGATVRSLNSRGLHLLRERLDATHGGDRQKWCLALIPLAAPSAVTLAAGSGMAAGLVAWILIMKQNALLTSLIAALVLTITASLFLDDGWLFAADNTTDPATISVSKQDPPSTAETSTANREEVIANAPETDPTKSEPPEVLGYLHHDDGTPAKDVLFFIGERDDTPRQEGMLSTDTSSSFARGQTFTTGADGACRVDRERADGLLWCQPVDHVWFAFDLETSRRTAQRTSQRISKSTAPEPRRFRLPKLAEFRIRMLGVAADDRWRVVMWPGYASDQDPAERAQGVPATEDEMDFGRAVILLHAGSEDGPVCTLVGEQNLRASGAEHRVTTLAGHPYRLEVWGTPFRVGEHGDEDRHYKAPVQLDYSAGERLPVLQCVVKEGPGQAPTKLGGQMIVCASGSVSHGDVLIDGRASIGYSVLEQGKEYPVHVLMNDGELFSQTIALRSVAQRPPLTFVRGRGKAAVEIRSPERDFANGDILSFEGENGKRLDWAIGYTNFHTGRGAPIGGVVISAEDPRILHVQIDRKWKRLQIIQKSGHIALVERSVKKPSYDCRWARTRELPNVDLKTITKRHGFESAAYFTFELQRTDAEGRKSWVVVDRFGRRPGDPVARRSDEWTTWHKVVPMGMAFRMSVTDPYRKRTVFFEPGR